jgi:glycosidase
LQKIGRWGFSGLWLIGLWERSAASQRIKQLRGNPDAVASAYSLFDYQIAGDLGGEEAYENLRRRAWEIGIRLASDMVPNHMGIDSRWVIEHPDWFISLDYNPFPSYSFNGPNLSWDDRVGIYLEDHYYDSSDAAVVFMRVDHWTGTTKFIYHGNDGTSFPWNDTAQLNYLLPEVREAVIQTILHVARKFPIIRFDAAMTLAKKHYQRLWFPEPGTGGAIPTRAEHGLTRDQFENAFPVEFWREVVDRVAQEVPDTLLLAEAFWLMEGYFVRTLGMHRVYNSAFMNMMRDEKNQEYRLVIKNTLEFDPEILKRYVNFMNNPDERTAVDQFGKGDKYFGICTLMATMPGLPMFGHGQVEGFTEKYGMEFRRAYWDEYADNYLVERHEREIFPLLHRRYLFAEVQDFLLYDFFSTEGSVNEDVFAYSNRAGDERALVIYHNRFADARGWIRDSAAYSVKIGQGEERQLVRRNLGEGLGLHNDGNYFTIFRDQVSGLEYIRNSHELSQNGLFIELGAYKYQVFVDFREVEDNEWHQYAQLTSYLNGRGVPSVGDAIKEIFLQPIHDPFRALVGAEMFRNLVIDNKSTWEVALNPDLIHDVEQKTIHLISEINEFIQADRDNDEIQSFAENIKQEFEAIQEITAPAKKPSAVSKSIGQFIDSVFYGLDDSENSHKESNAVLIGWTITHALGRIVSEDDYPARSRSWLDEFLFGKILANALIGYGWDEPSAWKVVGMIKILTNHQVWSEELESTRQSDYKIVSDWLKDVEIQRYLGINRYQGILWFNHEAYATLLRWMLAIAIIRTIADPKASRNLITKKLSDLHGFLVRLESAEMKSEYQVEKLLDQVKG